MDVISGNTMKGGWFIGDFEPSVYRTGLFEVCYKIHNKDEVWPIHYHRLSVEINYLIRGKMIIGNTELNAGDIFTINPDEIVNPKFIEKCEIIVVKVPSIPNDKHIIKE